MSKAVTGLGEKLEVESRAKEHGGLEGVRRAHSVRADGEVSFLAAEDDGKRVEEEE